ncbi:MAG: adenosylmethionine--8-amino-7-oxononanoate transaminase [Deltaproteobacteria bacterium]|jgi:adenosylmethionine-8-amino-7-oxononanoate aminotransferase|nr:adenosylmethionine--8-amino-7-oxononanoate transaminase [Deltaproteobacteria bacterium]MBW2533404.1 adenosylmethionine--8-amino-7-oxononanoate transaminase [Deltaproteobacteria bacterium]
MQPPDIDELVALDHGHVWHPFTPMRQWRERRPIIIERAEGAELVAVDGQRYVDGVSSLWCNVHGHRVPAIDQAVRDQLDRVAHTTMLGLGSVPSIRLAARLAGLAPGALSKVFYSDAGATATELAFKMAAGYFFHAHGEQRDLFVGVHGAYHGDTVGSMSVGYSELFHRPFEKMVFRCEWAPAPDVSHVDGWNGPAPGDDGLRRWALEDAAHVERVRDDALRGMDELLTRLGRRVAAVVVEPLVQGAAGIIVHPPGYLAGVAELAAKHGTLLVADEVATGFGRTGRMFACEHEGVEPDILCLGKGLTGGYLPLAATLATDRVEQAFCGELTEHRTLYHGHTYTGNPLACAAALASLDLFDQSGLLDAVRAKAERLRTALRPLRDARRYPHVIDVRQRGLMVGIELSADGSRATGFDPSRRLGYEVCDGCRAQGVIVRPLGNVVVLMPPLGIEPALLDRLAEVVVAQIGELSK